MGADGISEKFSAKGKRGRPRLLHPEMREILAMGQQYSSERTILNTSYRLRAFGLLEHEPWAQAWLLNSTSREGKPGTRRTILTELGRVTDDERLIFLARLLCEQQPTTAAAIAFIRRCRHGDQPLNLVQSLAGTIEAYWRAHPAVTLAELVVNSKIPPLFPMVGKEPPQPDAGWFLALLEHQGHSGAIQQDQTPREGANLL
jgi:hypothetical protein